MKLSAFADEISPDINKQIAVLHEWDIRAIDLRSVDGVNVLDFTDDAAASYGAALQSAGITVAAIGSPVGKVPIDLPENEQTARFERAVALAHRFGTPNIRIFSFYRPAGLEVPAAQYREDVISRLGTMTERARAEGITLLHENDVHLYGDTVERCLELQRAIDDQHFRAAFDPANFILSGEEPYPAAYEALRPWIAAVHVKDAVPGGPVLPAGEGIARWREILAGLRASGYNGYLSLEPHLSTAGQSGGFSGPDGFRLAVQSLRELLRAVDWQPD